LKNYTRVDYRCIHCQQSFGDPDRQRVKVPFIAWLRSVVAHVLLAHHELVQPERLDIANAYVAPTYF
jgi:hypothetical protein